MGEIVTKIYVCDFCGKQHTSKYRMIQTEKITQFEPSTWAVGKVMKGNLFCDGNCLISAIKEWQDMMNTRI